MPSGIGATDRLSYRIDLATFPGDLSFSYRRSKELQAISQWLIERRSIGTHIPFFSSNFFAPDPGLEIPDLSFCLMIGSTIWWRGRRLYF
ncbi:hypothetical protein [Roseomonas haemaphysalidis]|uniref:Uncharacterized protein n=1 Tax=Roseomonas haemaphysalidis TaxID=2768162 RepID=A0ABS3KPA1_9PROT|nr:hypothetical protein [Roseomonas haemaphysalidis]MBO1079300.1 hypothetical protein [Roseomonas haemaphysalidis]